jgi:hypothetical protein
MSPSPRSRPASGRPRRAGCGHRDRDAGGDGGSSSLANAWDDLSRARLRQGVRRGGDGRRPRRLVRGDRAVPPPARPADPPHRDHPAQQGPDRRDARRLPAREFPDPVGGRAAHAQRRRRRRDRPLPRQPGAEGRMREGASRLLADLLESLDQERLGGMVKSAVAARLRRSRSRPCSARRSRRR